MQIHVERPAHVTLRIFNTLGQRVRTLYNGSLPGGPHTLYWDGRTDQGRTAASGVYLCAMQAGDVVATRSMLHLK